MSESPYKDYNDFWNKSQIQNAIVFLSENNPNMKEQIEYWKTELKNALQKTGFPVVCTKKAKRKTSIKQGKTTTLVFLWDNGETSLDWYDQSCNNAVNWFNQYVKDYLNS